MKTRERILYVSLDLFNSSGEPSVTTIDIANEMDISPGNLYYHYRNKDEIITELFKRFEAEMLEVLNISEDVQLNMLDVWMYIHIIFEKIWNYRFIYRDMSTILDRNSSLKSRFNRLLDAKKASARSICRSLSETGVISISTDDIDSMTDNIVLVTTFWLNLQQVRQKKQCVEPEEPISQGVYQVISLVSPFLSEGDKTMLEELRSERR